MTGMTAKAGQKRGNLSEVASLHNMHADMLGHRFTKGTEARLAEMSLAVRENIKRSHPYWQNSDVVTLRIKARRRHQKVMVRPAQKHVVVDCQAESTKSDHDKRLLDRIDAILQMLRDRARERADQAE